MGGQVACKRDEIGALGDPLERFPDLVTVPLVAMDVARSRDLDG